MKEAFPADAQPTKPSSISLYPRKWRRLEHKHGPYHQDQSQVIQQQKMPTNYGICFEILKLEIEEIPKLVCKIFQKIWDTEETPYEWKKGIIFNLPKKGNLGDCNNWQGITLLTQTSKFFSRIILKRLTIVLDIITQEQAGFRKGRSCSD